MGPENEVNFDSNNAKVQIFVDGEWVDLPVSQVEFNLEPVLPPGRLFGENIEQIEEGVYFVPDMLLQVHGVVELWSFAQALADEFNRSNPGTTVTIERDVVRSGTRMVVTVDGDAGR